MKAPKILTVLITLFILSSCSSENEDVEIYSEAFEKTVDVDYSVFEKEVLTVVNTYRASLDLDPLDVNDLASYEADTHTDYMIEQGTISHDNFVDRQEYLVTNANAKKVGENVAFGYSTAQEVLDAWLSSSSHKALIESSSYTHFGISVAESASGRNYFTQIFIKK